MEFEPGTQGCPAVSLCKSTIQWTLTAVVRIDSQT
jgi:hypothetical protein